MRLCRRWRQCALSRAIGVGRIVRPARTAIWKTRLFPGTNSQGMGGTGREAGAREVGRRYSRGKNPGPPLPTRLPVRRIRFARPTPQRPAPRLPPRLSASAHRLSPIAHRPPDGLLSSPPHGRHRSRRLLGGRTRERPGVRPSKCGLSLRSFDCPERRLPFAGETVPPAPRRASRTTTRFHGSLGDPRVPD